MPAVEYKKYLSEILLKIIFIISINRKIPKNIFFSYTSVNSIKTYFFHLKCKHLNFVKFFEKEILFTQNIYKELYSLNKVLLKI